MLTHVSKDIYSSPVFATHSSPVFATHPPVFARICPYPSRLVSEGLDCVVLLHPYMYSETTRRNQQHMTRSCLEVDYA
jgi:hypothetical protein